MGRRLETGIRADAGEPRFLADSMLAKLARWLRALGYDAAWEAEIADAELIRRGIAERCTVLTRDRRIPDEWWTDHVLLLESEAPLDQLREVVTRLGLPWGERLFTRCTECNVLLEAVDRAEVAGAVPPGVRATQNKFVRCPSCRRVYWQGSHTERMRRTLRETLEL